MRVVFMGASAYGLKCLNAIWAIKEVNVTGVVTTPKEFTLTYNAGKEHRFMKNEIYTDIMELCEKHNTDCFVIQKMNEQRTVDIIKEWEPDLIVVSGWYHMIGKAIRDIPSLGVVGLHSSLLPRYKGGAPLVWQMINGEKKAGITLFYIEQGVDSGDIIAQAEEAIDEQDTIGTLYEKIGIKGIELLQQYLPLIAAGKAPRIKQDKAYENDIWPQRKPEDGLIDWRKSPREIERFVRAQTKPYPGAYTIIEGKKVIIWDCTVIDEHNEKSAGDDKLF